ncbi:MULTISPECIES: glycosyltransferase WbuB [unclassified Variovorax]|jgi:colanic acid biosynthesis glycosyl transferase WcaI|uniref:glycosyltransferase WbuB n=1 Tax=unclassified Variovorax TaxID=663243 RepID=UPI000F7DAAC8|nr:MULTISPECIES: glycosyltransferase WbuB [unclassified Variovorax]RSZ37257.1 colanic acid biosynthesis glycosyltransferase WcaI [Variovorax sp. 553]RSZ38071.1 colanic acid biosynthesis glycosyltransferase WcaI [Variovorax sp. 679]
MKILVYSMNFAPELAGIGKYSGEMAEWLQSRGHEVRVIASPPFFPQWAVSEGYSAWAYRKDDWNGITVWRAPTWVPQKPRALGRIGHLLSFTLSSIPLLLAQLRWKPDVVFVVEPPISCAPAALCLAKLLGTRSWLHIQDYEVDAAFGLGWVRGERVRRFALAAERWLMRKFDRVSTISSTMLAKARDKGVDESRLVLFPNWVDVEAIRPVKRGALAAGASAQGYRAELGIPADAVVVLYAGSLGSKQGIELLADAARLLVCSHNIHFVFCGNGPSRASLMDACLRLDNAHFLDLQPAGRLSELLGMADIHVLPQRADAADLVMPSKLGGMLASGRAVIVTAHAGTALSEAVWGRGVVVEPGDAAALADAIEQLSMSPATRELMGSIGRRFAEAELDRNVILQRLEKELQRCAVA